MKGRRPAERVLWAAHSMSFCREGPLSAGATSRPLGCEGAACYALAGSVEYEMAQCEPSDSTAVCGEVMRALCEGPEGEPMRDGELPLAKCVCVRAWPAFIISSWERLGVSPNSSPDVRALARSR